MTKQKFDEQAVLVVIAEGNYDATSLINTHLPTAEQRFERLDKALRDYLTFVRQVFPAAQYYTASGGFNLMLGNPHNDKLVPQQELIAFSGLARIGDGDF